ncbi:dihydropteroate synthase [Ulvibacterium marinum]|uniref:Dihydropteroate synthase n=1 Tax=Ulvibacterium marinum TaxID=2419782 RepID=A0A3B0C3K6_9FLAO|nr:dihydropteroate synthase [Ulvibacterium marinum]RKN79900.1 dihydropteroate synthase [Ulvibacterium marinum]
MTINCKGTLIDLNVPRVMGVLNITPDSFFDGGKYKDEKTIVSQVEKMLNEGATFIDVGAQSSRPGAELISEKEELDRILPIVNLLINEFPEIVLSIDTFRSKVAEKCIEAGAALINDISAGNLDKAMLPKVAQLKVPIILMHMRGEPKTMQQQTDYNDLIHDILKYFSERIAKARSLGVHDIVIDPGFGFSKTLKQNYELLKGLDLLLSPGLPILTGLSRKSMIYKMLELDAKDALNGTTALNMYALQKGASVLRVHDVKEAMECIKLSTALV